MSAKLGTSTLTEELQPGVGTVTGSLDTNLRWDSRGSSNTYPSSLCISLKDRLVLCSSKQHKPEECKALVVHVTHSAILARDAAHAVKSVFVKHSYMLLCLCLYCHKN